MLKIKDDVDLKELEKFGFTLCEYNGDDKYYQFDLEDNRTYITIGFEDKEIGIATSLYGDMPSPYIENLDILYILITYKMIEII